MTTLSAGAAAGLLVALMVIATTDGQPPNRPSQPAGNDQTPSGLSGHADRLATTAPVTPHR